MLKVPKERELEEAIVALQIQDDQLGCKVVKVQLDAVRRVLASLSVCRCCFIEKPSYPAQVDARERWRGPGQNWCPGCWCHLKDGRKRGKYAHHPENNRDTATNYEKYRKLRTKRTDDDVDGDDDAKDSNDDEDDDNEFLQFCIL